MVWYGHFTARAKPIPFARRFHINKIGTRGLLLLMSRWQAYDREIEHLKREQISLSRELAGA
eukprot:8451920-Prorocentrum_lima.AAC.1